MKADVGGRGIPHAGVILVIGVGFLLTWNWPYETALFPRMACTVVLIVGIISLIGELIRGRGREVHSDAGVSSHLVGDHSRGRAALVFAWLVLFLVGVWALGYQVAAIAFVFLFMKLSGKQSWRISVLFTGLSFVFLYSVFHLLLGVIWPRGALPEMVGL